MEVVIRSANASDAAGCFKLIAELGYPDLPFARFARTYQFVLDQSSNDGLSWLKRTVK